MKPIHLSREYREAQRVINAEQDARRDLFAAHIAAAVIQAYPGITATDVADNTWRMVKVLIDSMPAKL